jgi:hypothetical protein
MDLRFHPHDKEYNLLRKILGTIQGENGFTIPTSSAAGTIQEVSGTVTAGGITTVVKVTPPLDSSATQYAAGDALGAAFEIPEAVRAGILTGNFHSITAIDLEGLSTSFELLLFSEEPTASTFTANAPPTIAAADAANLLAKVTVTPGDLIASIDITTVANIGTAVKSTNTTSLWGAVVVTSTPTYSNASAIRLHFGFLQD